MIKLLQLFRKPHPFIFSKASILLPAGISFLLFLVIGPYGIAQMAWNYRILLSSLFGLNGAVSVIIVVGGLLLIKPRKLIEENWTIGKEVLLILSVVLIICILNFGFFVYSGMSPALWHALLIQTVLKTFAISIFPVLILVLFEQYMYKRKSLNEALILTESLKARSFKQKVESKIQFYGENEKFEIALNSQELVLIKSDGNYVEVFYLNEEKKLEKHLIRNRLKYFVDILPQENFFQCHKSFLINSSYIRKIDGNARKLNVTLDYFDETIPVSRSKASELKAMLNTK